jgi:acetyltransferase
MKNFFNPKTIAVVGASSKKGKVGYSLIKKLSKFKGKVFPVNLKDGKILGIKCYKSILDIKSAIDLVIIAVPAKNVKNVLKECVKKKVKNVSIISAGFSEVGNKDMEEELLKVGKGINILGPNSFGIANPYLNLDMTFALKSPKKGSIAFISQSGALWSAISEYGSKNNFGFSGFVSLGNMIDVGFSEFIEYFNKNKNTKCIVLYVENLKHGKKFMNVVRKSKKPVIIVKSGSSEAGKKATISHTGSLAGSYEIYKAAFKQCGAIITESLTVAFDKAKNFIKANKVVIVTNAGGPGALLADYCDKNGLKLIKIPKVDFSFNYSGGNPIDVIGDAREDRFKEVFGKIKKLNFDTLIVIVTPQEMTPMNKIAEEVVKFNQNSKKNVVCCWMGCEGKGILERNKIPNFFEPKRVADFLKS